MSGPEANSSWIEWSKYVLMELERQAEEDASLSKQVQAQLVEQTAHKVRIENLEKGYAPIQQNTIDIAQLKIRAGWWGAVGGVISAAAVGLLVWGLQSLLSHPAK